MLRSVSSKKTMLRSVSKTSQCLNGISSHCYVLPIRRVSTSSSALIWLIWIIIKPFGKKCWHGFLHYRDSNIDFTNPFINILIASLFCISTDGVLHLLAAHNPWLCPWNHLRHLCPCCPRLWPAREGILYPCVARLFVSCLRSLQCTVESSCYFHVNYYLILSGVWWRIFLFLPILRCLDVIFQFVKYLYCGPVYPFCNCDIL